LKSAELTYRVCTSILECAELWDEFLPANHHLASVHCAVIERCNLEDVSFRYVIVSNHNKEVVAVAYFQWLRFMTRHYSFPLAKNFLLKKIEDAVMKNGFNILVCGNLLRIDAPGLYYNSGKANATSVFSVLEEFFQTLHPYPHVILVKDWNQYLDEKWIRQFHFQSWPSDLTMKLDLSSWKTFDEYVAALRHRYAQRIRKTRKKLLSVVRQEFSLEEIETFSPQLEMLYLEVVKRQPIRMIIVNGNYFAEMKKAYGERFRLFGYFSENKLIAFSSNIVFENLWELHYIGIDYPANETHWLYFNILFDAIADAIEGGKNELELGRTARAAKTSLGARPVYFKNYMRLKGLIPRLAVKLLGQNFNENVGQNWEERNAIRAVKHQK